jgi:hypothetical protein
MKTLSQETTLDGLSQKLPDFSKQLVAIIDKAMDLEASVGWYDQLDSKWGGPPTKDELRKTASELRQIYLNLASITGLDPCEQFECTKQQRLSRLVTSRK